MRRGGVLNGLVAILGTISQTGLGVRLETGARRDLLTHDDIGLEVEQMVDLALDGGLGEDAAVRMNDAEDSRSRWRKRP